MYHYLEFIQQEQVNTYITRAVVIEYNYSPQKDKNYRRYMDELRLGLYKGREEAEKAREEIKRLCEENPQINLTFYVARVKILTINDPAGEHAAVVIPRHMWETIQTTIRELEADTTLVPVMYFNDIGMDENY